MVADAPKEAGATPKEWLDRLEKAAEHPEELEAVLAELSEEMASERSWLHANPSPDGLLTSLIGFLTNDKDDDYERLAGRIRSELAREQQVLERYRSWKPGEDAEDRLFLYVKDFGGKLEPDGKGVQFPGFVKYQGIYETDSIRESYVFYLNERFPGRDPANFHVVFVKETGEIIIKRVYRMELPRIEGTSAARAVLAEMIAELVTDRSAITEFEVDNAANIKTRQALMDSEGRDEQGIYRMKQEADPSTTPIGNLMVKLAQEMDLKPGEFKVSMLPYGMMKIEMFMRNCS